MGLSEWRTMRNADKNATDIRSGLRNGGGMTAEDAKARMKHERDENGSKLYKPAKGTKRKPTPNEKQDRAAIARAKKAEKKAKQEQKRNSR